MDQREQDNETRDASAELPTSVAELRSLVLDQQKRLEQQSLFIDQLLEQIRLARHQHFGVRSERFSLDQMALAFNEAEAAAAGSDDPDAEQPDLFGTVAVPAHRRAKGGRRPLPANTNTERTSTKKGVWFIIAAIAGTALSGCPSC